MNDRPTDFEPINTREPLLDRHPVLRRLLTYLVGVGLGLVVLAVMQSAKTGTNPSGASTPQQTPPPATEQP